MLVTALAYSSCRRSGVRALPPLRILYSFQLDLQYSNILSSYGHPLSVHCYSSFTFLYQLFLPFLLTYNVPASPLLIHPSCPCSSFPIHPSCPCSSPSYSTILYCSFLPTQPATPCSFLPTPSSCPALFFLLARPVLLIASYSPILTVTQELIPKIIFSSFLLFKYKESAFLRPYYSFWGSFPF